MIKLIIISAASGTGKSTLINRLLQKDLGLEFSISVTSRLPRGKEQNGVEYYFISSGEFKNKIEHNELVEYVEVYKDVFYGTLRSEIDRITAKGHHVVFDLDVLGALKLKEQFGENALSIFIQPPSIEVLENRLRTRATDTDEVIKTRLERAEYELTFAEKFDTIVVNDDLDQAENELYQLIKNFLQ